MKTHKKGSAAMKALYAIAIIVTLALFTSTQVRRSTPPVYATADFNRGPDRESFCGGDACPKQVLVKLNRCSSKDNKGNFTLQFEKFTRVLTEDRTLNITPVGRGCLFLASSSTLNIHQLKESFTRFQKDPAMSEKQMLSAFGLNLVSVEYVEPNFMIHFNSNQSPIENVPNDDYFVSGALWGLVNTAKPGLDIDAVSAWKFATGSSRIVVGVMDSGIFYDHPDLAENIWSAPREFKVQLGGVSILCPKGSHGYNALGTTTAEKCNPYDDVGHGTLVSGIIGAQGNNKLGVVGVNWKVKMMGLRIGNIKGTCVSNAINAIDFALQVKEQFPYEANLRVLNNSWGFLLEGSCAVPRSLEEKIAEAGNHGMLVVCAAGQNKGNDNDVTPHYPSGFALSNVLSVTAFQQEGKLTAGFGNEVNHGNTTVHLGAPGNVILSTYIEPRLYDHGGQTSMATAFVSGAAALVLSVPQCADLQTPELKRIIMEGTVRTPSLINTATGGRLNVYNSIIHCAKKR